MYWIIDGLCFSAGIAGFILSFTEKKPAFCWVGPLWIAAYPLILEGIINLFSLCCQKTQYAVVPRSRIVYHPNYNISFCGIEKIHPFDSQKYGNIYNILLEKGLINEDDVIKPDMPSRSFLLEKISKLYLLKMCYTLAVCKYIEIAAHNIYLFNLLIP